MTDRNTASVIMVGALTVWYGLSFIGVSGLVSRWELADGLWFFLAAALGIGLLIGSYAVYRNQAWGYWQLLGLLAVWWYTQFMSHWYRFVFPPSAESVQQYYATFPYWYLLPKSSARIVPDGFHTILHILMIMVTVMAIDRVFRQLRGTSPVA